MNKILALFIFTMFVYFKNRKRIGDGLRLYRLRRPILRNQPHQHSWQTMLQRRRYLWYHPLFLRKYQHIFQRLNQPNNLPQLGHELSNSSRLQNLNQVPVSLEINDSTLTSHMPRSNLQKGLELYLANIKKTEEERKKEQFWKEFKLQLYKDIKLKQIFLENIKEKEKEKENENEVKSDENEPKFQSLNDENDENNNKTHVRMLIPQIYNENISTSNLKNIMFKCLNRARAYQQVLEPISIDDIYVEIFDKDKIEAQFTILGNHYNFIYAKDQPRGRKLDPNIKVNETNYSQYFYPNNIFNDLFYDELNVHMMMNSNQKKLSDSNSIQQDLNQIQVSSEISNSNSSTLRLQKLFESHSENIKEKEKEKENENEVKLLEQKENSFRLNSYLDLDDLDSESSNSIAASTTPQQKLQEIFSRSSGSTNGSTLQKSQPTSNEVLKVYKPAFKTGSNTRGVFSNVGGQSPSDKASEVYKLAFKAGSTSQFSPYFSDYVQSENVRGATKAKKLKIEKISNIEKKKSDLQLKNGGSTKTRKY